MTRHTTEAELAAVMGEVQTLPEPRRVRLFSLEDLRDLPAPSWLVEGLVPDRGVSVLFGASGSMKSFVALDWALCVSSGKDWLGRAIGTGPAVYLALEGGFGLAKRVDAWRETYPSADCTSFRAVIDLVSLIEDADVELLVDAVKNGMDEPPRLVVIDTLARAMPGGDENSSRDTGLLIAAADQIVRNFNCAVVLVHHTGHSETGRERGSSSLPAAADVRLRISRTKDRLRLTTMKQKDAAEQDPINLTYRGPSR